ncbi:TPA: segregation and condensation protein A, partial [Clostridioides difficile]|nr:segregation and condensation protein A [Clostridioides difficile]
NITYVNERFYRNKEEIIIDDNVDLEDISIEAIKNILPYIFKVKTSQIENANDEKLDKIVRKKIISVEEKILYIRDIIKEKIEVTFTNIIKSYENDEIIATFLSILELIKEKEIVVVQDIFFDDILIRKSSEC